jgi:hypothetical protein
MINTLRIKNNTADYTYYTSTLFIAYPILYSRHFSGIHTGPKMKVEDRPPVTR